LLLIPSLHSLSSVFLFTATSTPQAYIRSLHDALPISARSEGRDHDLVAIGSLAAGPAKRVGFAVGGRISFLHPAIVALAQKLSFASEKSGADRNSAFGESGASLCERNLQHRLVLFSLLHYVRDHVGCS